jgi:NTE family protein
VAGALASGMSPRDTRELMFGLEKKDFWDPAPGLGLLRGKKFHSILEKNFAPTFAAARTPLEVAVFDVFRLRTSFLTEGPLPRAVVASCAVPLLFHPVRIGRRVYSDGGVLHKSGLRLAHPEERTLCIFLQHDGLAEAYEMGRSLGKLGPHQKVLRLKNLPKVNPNSLGQGRAAFGQAKLRTLAALDKPLRGSILDG